MNMLSLLNTKKFKMLNKYHFNCIQDNAYYNKLFNKKNKSNKFLD